MSDQSLLESIIEHDSDAILVYGSFLLALGLAAVFGPKVRPMYLVPAVLGLAFLGLVGYYYRQTVRDD